VGERRRLVGHAFDALLVLVAFAAAAWALLLSALCIGDACTEDLRVRWWAWLAIAAALGGSALLFRYRRLGRVLLTAPILVALVATFAGA
jgi:hypothetical protein